MTAPSYWQRITERLDAFGLKAWLQRSDVKLHIKPIIGEIQAELDLHRKLSWLAARDHIFWGTYNGEIQDWDDGAHPAVLCNDIFVPGDDGESLALAEVDAYIDLCRKYPDDADAAWCAAKRNMKPWRNFKLNDEAVAEARRLIAALTEPRKENQ